MNSKKISLIVLTAIMMFFFLAVMPVSAEVTELWNRTYDGGGGDAALGVATDASGNVIVTRSSADVNNQPGKYYTIKYGETTGTPPEILSYAPASPINDTEGATRTFNITIDQIVNVSWRINGTEVQTNESVMEVTYTNTSAAAGTWNVSAIASNANGTDMQVWVWNVTLKENQPPVANFTYSPANPIVAQTITFNASNSTDPDGNITKYEWTFGDGHITNTTEQNITYSYASAGTFTVNLTVTDDDGATNTTTKEIVIQPVQDTTPPASITTLTSTLGHTWINWTWKNPADADFNYTMVYLNGTWQTNTSNEYYNATGLVTNTSYKLSTHTVDLVGNVNVTWINQTTMTQAKNQPPIASFTYTHKNPVENEELIFNASSSYDIDGNITKYEWSFGDGNITNTTEQNITYSYASAGTFTVNLTVTDDDGATNTTSRAITVSEGFVFNTYTGTYPSIAGTHNGTIELNQAIIVQKLYTYPCSGTGGHTEYAKICNDSWSVETLPWAGYNGDWHSLSFPESFKLCANKTYNYEIRTSSYPQIHHTDALLTVNGLINCTEFVDVNGERYDNWIPAIILGYNVTPTPPTTGAINIASSPSGAVIELDGASMSYKTNVTISDVSPGTHAIKLTLDDYPVWSTNVSVTVGEISYVHATLTKPTPTPTPTPTPPPEEEEIPEFSTIAIPLSITLVLLYYYRRKR
ncbi:MAG: PKD domain-containing protein, partial [Methanosarcinales archaeon]